MFDEINKVLDSKSLPELTEQEKGLIMSQCRQTAMQWQMAPKATDHEYALTQQLKAVLSNAIYDVLVKTRGYK